MFETKTLTLAPDDAAQLERYGWRITSETVKEKSYTISGSTSYSGTVSDSGKVYLTKHSTPDHEYIERTYTYTFQRNYKSERQKNWLHLYEGIHSFFFFYPWVLFVLAGIVLITFSIIASQVPSSYLFVNPDTPHSGIPQTLFIGGMIAVGLSVYGGYAWLLKDIFGLPTFILTILTLPLRLIALKEERKERNNVSVKKVFHVLSIPLMIVFAVGWGFFTNYVLQQYMPANILTFLVMAGGVIFFIVAFWILFEKTS